MEDIALEHVRPDRRELIVDHVKFAQKLTRTFYYQQTNGIGDYDELQSSAFVGLCDAAQRYDAARGMTFETFSFLRIRGAMFDYLRRTRAATRSEMTWLTSVRTDDDGKPLYEERSPCTPRELASVVGTMEEPNIRLWVDEESSAVDLSYESTCTPEDYAEAVSLKHYLKRVLDRLPKREALVIEMYYFRGWSFQEMRGYFDGASRSWLCRLHLRALDRLREILDGDNRQCARKTRIAESER